MFESFYLPERPDLHVERQRRGEALQIIFVRSPPFRLEEELMAVLAREGAELVFYRRTVPRPYPDYLAGEQRALVEAASEDFVNSFICMDYVAVFLDAFFLYARRHRHKREAGRRFITFLDRQCAEVD